MKIDLLSEMPHNDSPERRLNYRQARIEALCDRMREQASTGRNGELHKLFTEILTTCNDIERENRFMK